LSVYADSSFIVSLYIRDLHTPEVLRRMSVSGRVWLTPFHELEFAHAIAQSLWRRFGADVADEILRDLARDRDSGLWLRADFPSAAFPAGKALAMMHVPVTGTRTLDTLHVAAALELHATEFWTFDDRQAKLAKAVGLNVA
jgi:predicted nucleic acid-binding protein